MFICNKVILWICEKRAYADFEVVLKILPGMDSRLKKCPEQVFRVQPTNGQVRPTPYSIMEPADYEFFAHTNKSLEAEFSRDNRYPDTIFPGILLPHTPIRLQ